MISLRRVHELLGADAGRRVTRTLSGLHAPPLRAYVVDMRGGQRFDAGLVGVSPQQASLGARALSFQLGGELVVRRRAEERTVPEGSCARMDVEAWNERWEGEFRVLVLEWYDEGLPLGFEAARIGGGERRALAAFADLLLEGRLQGRAAAHALTQLTARLSSAGYPLRVPDARELYEGAPEGAQELATVLGATLSHMPSSPQLVDVATSLQVSERHVRRRLSTLGGWLPGYSQPGAWRRRLRMLRTNLASSFLTVGGVHLEAVARSVGYGSARAMCLAFDQEGLPRPSTFRAL